MVMFGVQTFMSQIETLFFINALQLPFDLVMRIIASGFLRALVFAPLAVVILSKLRGTPDYRDAPRLVMSQNQWLIRFALLSLVYVIVYFAFGATSRRPDVSCV